MQGMLALIPDEATFVHNILNFGRFLKYGGFVITPAACSLSLKSGRSLKLRGQRCRPLPMGTHLLQPRSWFANAGDFFCISISSCLHTPGLKTSIAPSWAVGKGEILLLPGVLVQGCDAKMRWSILTRHCSGRRPAGNDKEHLLLA